MEMENRTFPGLFHFPRTQFLSNFVLNNVKNAFFQPVASKLKGALDFFDSDTGDKNRDYRTN